MAIETREGPRDAAPLLLSWGAASPEPQDGLLDAALLWVSGGLALLLWTGLALVLTAA